MADAMMGNAAGETMSTAGLEMAPVGEAIAVADELPEKAADKEMLIKEIFDKLLGDLLGAADYQVEIRKSAQVLRNCSQCLVYDQP